MAGPLDALERMMEEVFEGTVQRLFRPKLQPVQLAKAAARQMEQHQVIGPSGPEVPNSYRISLNPKDFESFARYQVALQRELRKYLEKYARDRRWLPVSEVSVALVADASIPAGRPRVIAQMLDTAQDAPAGGPAGGDDPIEHTVRMRRTAPSRDNVIIPGQAAPASLVGEKGERFELAQPVAKLGRALENDVVIPDQRVSRYHAEIRQENGRYVLRDLGSTNGTQVASETIDQQELQDGETISLGGYRLVFRQI